jgi:hypothetical protein
MPGPVFLVSMYSFDASWCILKKGLIAAIKTKGHRTIAIKSESGV